MNYVHWALVALAAYTLVAPLMSIATTGDVRMPSDVAVLFSNSILVAASLAITVFSHHRATEYLSHPKLPYVMLAGVCLSVGILAYYRALSLGPVSVVVPIFGSFVAASSLVGMAFLGEPFSARKLLGVGFALLAVYLVSGQ